MKERVLQIRKHRNLLLASAVILAAVCALLIMQYQLAKRSHEHLQRTMKANLELHLFEISEDARRGILDHANHIMHGIRQQRVRERNIPSIERAFTRLAKRYPEIDDYYVVFFERGAENETWKALKFIRPDENDPNVNRFEGAPVGNLIEDAETSASLHHAWNSIKEKEDQTALYTAFDLRNNESAPRQYFFHTVYEVDRLKRDKPLENIGLIVFSAAPDKFPSQNFFKKIIAKHEARDKEIENLTGKIEYRVSLGGSEKKDLVSTGENSQNSLTRRFDSQDYLFPNLIFEITTPQTSSQIFSNQYTFSSIILGLIAALVAVIGLVLTWRAARREMLLGQTKSDFLASISHELKTPLTAIRAFGDLLHSGRANKPERIREYGGIIKTESDRLTNLINNILEMSRLERGVRKYRMEEGDLKAVILETVEVFRHSPEAESFDIQTAFPIHLVESKFDESAIRQVIFNLLSNAVKYSEKVKNPRIEIILKTEIEKAVVEVKDYGLGISKEDLKDIFLPFHRSSNDEIQAKGGTGLGLAIVKEIIRAHGGDVSVESEAGNGATFRFRLPLLLESAKEETAENTEKEDGSYFGYRRRTKRSYRIAR